MITTQRLPAIVLLCLLTAGLAVGGSPDVGESNNHAPALNPSSSLVATAQLGASAPLMATVFDDLRTNPRAYQAVAAAEGAFTPMDIMDTVLDRTAYFEKGALRPSDSDDSPAKGALGLPPPVWRSWAGYLGGKVDQDSIRGDYCSTAAYNGLMFISSVEVSRATAVGFHVAYADTSIGSGDPASNIASNGYAGGVFAVFRPASRLTLSADAAYGYYANVLDRWNDSGAYRGDYGQDLVAGGVRAAYDFELPLGLMISPFAGLRYQHLRQDSFRESGSVPVYANDVDALYGNAVASSLGASVSREFSMPGGRVINPVLSVAWRHDWGDRQYSTWAGFAGTQERFRVYSATRDRNSADLGVNLKAALLKTDRAVLDFEAGCNLAVNRDYVGKEWFAGMGIQF